MALSLTQAFANDSDGPSAFDFASITTTADAAGLFARDDLPEEMASEQLKQMSFRKTRSLVFNSMLEFREAPEEIHFYDFEWGSVEFARYPANPYATSLRERFSNEKSVVRFREPLYLNSDANRMTIDRHPRTDGRAWDRRGDLFLLHRCRTMSVGRGQMVCVVSMHLNLQANPYRLLDDESSRFHAANHQIIEVDLYEAN